ITGDGSACLGTSARGFGAGFGTGTAWAEAVDIMSAAAKAVATAAAGHFIARKPRVGSGLRQNG
ncbi:MAG: hypothetical protein U0987_16785, partial [Afipia sp.]|nr:hypothetical protein [Afipia sp.]